MRHRTAAGAAVRERYTGRVNEQELRAYAVRGLSTRLAELDEERSRIVVLLEQWGTATTPAGEPRVRRAPRERARIEPVETLAAGAQPGVPHLPIAESEVARVLPRRHRVKSRPPEDVPVPVLPPMPRLVKNRAN